MTAGLQPDPCPELPVERGPRGKGVGSWVHERKHRYLAEYLHATRRAWAAWPQRVYVDPFCSFGRMLGEGESFTRDGGAVVAWRESVAGGAPFTRVLVGDLEPDRSAACTARLAKLGAPVERFTGPASEAIVSMVARVPKGALCMTFIDPYNLEHLTMDLFKALAPLRTDIAAHFSVYDLNRNKDLEFDPKRARFDGTAPGWRTDPAVLAANKVSLPGVFFRYWHGMVKGLGGWEGSREMPLIKTDNNSPRYRLVFFAKDELPLRIWNDVARNGPEGQASLSLV
ncbi:MAG: three-Cys-motif partner protein TcmP [Rubrivivax sp.]|nr:three-Cys-motif partner protein TcmP [Rubrivivax sp.]